MIGSSSRKNRRFQTSAFGFQAANMLEPRYHTSVIFKLNQNPGVPCAVISHLYPHDGFAYDVSHQPPDNLAAHEWPDSYHYTYTDPNTHIGYEETDTADTTIENNTAYPGLKLFSDLQSSMTVSSPPNVVGILGNSVGTGADFTYNYVDSGTSHAITYPVVQSGAMTFRSVGNGTSSVDFQFYSNEVAATSNGAALTVTYYSNDVQTTQTDPNFFGAGTHTMQIYFYRTTNTATTEHISYSSALTGHVTTTGGTATTNIQFAFNYSLDVSAA